MNAPECITTKQNPIFISDDDGDDDVVVVDAPLGRGFKAIDMSLTLHMSSMPSIPTSNCQISMVSQKDEGTGNSRSFDDSKSSLSYLQFALPSPSWAISNRAATATKPIEPTSLPMCKPWPQRLYTSTARSLNSSRSFAVSPSIPPPSFHTGSGSAEKVIDLSEDDISDFGFTLQKPEQEQECFADSDPRTVSLGNHTKIQRRSTGLRGQRDSTDPVCGVPSHTVDSSPSSAIRTGNARLHSLSVSEVIELEGWADLKDAIPEGSEVFCLEDVYHEDPRPKGIRRSVKTTKIDLRNPSIVAPLSKCKSFTHKNMVLRPTKTVELRDGSFIRIQHVILNTLTQDVTLRGHRLQRARHLNGLLESKVNEVILFLEVDLNDPRPELEQGAIEVPINDVVKVRHARFTNRKFPDCRAIFMGDFHNNIDAAERGGLTIRWKYTCRYASATDRYHNVYRERTLERIKPDECLSMYALADDTRRSLWRGETIRGGSFQPMTDGKQLHVLLSQEDLLREEVILTAKRKYSDGSDGLELKTQLAPKRVRCKEQGQLEETKHLFSGAQFGQEMLPKRTIIDLSCDDIDTNAVLLSSNTQEHRSPPSLQHQPNTSFPSNSLSSIPKIIDPISSDLSTPPPSGSLYFTPPTPPPAIHRTANQALTYGDAFCGAGGSTRGALLAGLRPKWGFDFNTHACSSWRANFPFATCYNTDAHTFISRASLPQHRAGFKVDILHLSPPCQYFSPAHTVDGVDDEQNVASLFAVEEVIKVSRARVVTLEQTFGIVCARFRWFFNSLIQMFTSQDFSVRWAVVPLAQWGLPQRRNRLIIIASCPGEVLPCMPLPTHSDTDESLLPLVSVSSTLSSIPIGMPDHDPLSPSLAFPLHRHMPPWDDSKILPRAMTTSGGQNYHPSGKRDLTLREYACLQGFPLNHVFRGNYIKKQIGNAVPPCVAKVLFESIRRDLESADRIVQGVEIIE